MYSDIIEDIYSVFAKLACDAVGLTAYPRNYTGNIDKSKPYAIITVMPAKSEINAYDLTKKISGMLVLAIYVRSNTGDKELFQTADLLDDYFETKTFNNGTQFGTSYLKIIGIDPDDTSVYRGDYYIPFNAYGE